MAEETPANPAAVPETSKSSLKWIVFAVLGSLLLVAVSVATTWYLLTATKEPEAVEDAAAEAAVTPVRGNPVYINLKPPFTINLHDNQRVLRLSISILVYGATTEVEVARLMPQVRNALLVQLGDIKAADLETRAGKDKLREIALESVRKTVADKVDIKNIEAVYFTEFVMQ